MPSLQGIKTWLDYELYFLGVVVLLAVVLVGSRILLGLLDGVSVSAIELISLSVLVILASVWWVGRFR
jgi:uncharacterized membrane protein YkgB